MKMNRVGRWFIALTLGVYLAGFASAQERTKDPLAEPSAQQSDQKSGDSEHTKNPLTDSTANSAAEKQNEPEKQNETKTQNPLAGAPGQPAEKSDWQLERSLPKNLLKDQIAIWTSPAYVRTANSLWLVPFLGATAGFIATDRAAVSDLPSAPSTVNRFKNISDYGLYGTAAFSGALYLSGVMFSNPHQRETGWLAGEAVADGLAVNTVIQQITRRQRPFSTTNPGQWFQSSGSAFPSNHAMATFAAAAVIAREYPSLLTDVLAYGTAARWLRCGFWASSIHRPTWLWAA